MTTLTGVAPSVPWVLHPPRESAVGGERSVYEVGKRVLDVVLASALLVLLAPLMGVVALLIKLTSSGPVIFKQMRRGCAAPRLRCTSSAACAWGPRRPAPAGDAQREGRPGLQDRR